MKKPTVMVLIAVASPALAPPARAQLHVPGESATPPLEVTEDGLLVYGGDVAFECEQVGSGIVTPAANSSPETKAELERTNAKAIELCTRAGFPPAGTEGDTLADTGGTFLAPFALVAFAACGALIRTTVR